MKKISLIRCHKKERTYRYYCSEMHVEIISQLIKIHNGSVIECNTTHWDACVVYKATRSLTEKVGKSFSLYARTYDAINNTSP